MSSATLIGGFNFYAEDLTQQVMGKTRHGSHSIVYVLSGEVDSEIIHYHEEAHRTLNSATTVGQYLSALATAAARLPEDRDRLHDAVRNVSTLCIYTHEGFATAMQEILASDLLTDEDSARLRNQLPELYRIARDHYRTILNRIDPWVSALPNELANKCEEIIFRVLSIAAMSIPLADVVEGEAILPSYRVLKQIERNPPDTRLKQLSNAWTREFLGWSVFEYELARKDVFTTGTMRPMDDFLYHFAQELCRMAGLVFEPPNAINFGVMCKKMGLSDIIGYDGRDTPLHKRAILDSISRAINPSPKQLIPITWTSASNLIRRTVNRLGVVPDIVCEVLASPGQSEPSLSPASEQVLLGLHLYCDKQAQIDYLKKHRAVAEPDEITTIEQELDIIAGAPENAAFLILRLESSLPSETLSTHPEMIPEQLPHRSFVWVATDVLFRELEDGYRKYEQARFEACGRLVFPYFGGLNGLETYVALQAVPPKVELPKLVDLDPPAMEDYFDTKLGLLSLKLQSQENEYILPVVFPHRFCALIAESSRIPCTPSSYLDTCLCHTMVNGVYAEFLTLRS